MRTTLEKGFKKVFVVDRDILEALYIEAKRYLEAPLIRFSCPDGSNMETQDLKEILEFPNSNIRPIQSLRISGRNDTGFEIDVAMRHSYPNNILISYRLTGEEKEVLSLGNKLDEILSNAFQWYSFILYAREWIVLSVAIAGAVLGYLIGYDPRLHPDNQNFFLLITSAVVISTIVAGAGFGSKFFPSAVFAIGGGKGRYTAYKQRRKLLGSIVLTLLLTLLGMFIWNSI